MLILYEYVEGPSLNHCEVHNLREFLIIGLAVLSAVDHMHTHQVPHMALSPEHVFVRQADPTDALNVKLHACRLDLPASRVYTPPEPLPLLSVTPWSYSQIAAAVPDCFAKADVFSLGFMFFNILFRGAVLFDATKGLQCSKAACATFTVPPELMSLLTCMSAPQPSQRPALAEVQQALASMLCQTSGVAGTQPAPPARPPPRPTVPLHKPMLLDTPSPTYTTVPALPQTTDAPPATYTTAFAGGMANASFESRETPKAMEATQEEALDARDELTQSTLTRQLISYKIASVRAADIARVLMNEGLDSVGSLAELSDANFDKLDISIGERAKIRSFVKLSSSQLLISPLKLQADLITDVIPVQLLGKGQFGEVFKGVWGGSSYVAMKRVSKGHSDELLHEAHVLASLRHPHILQFYGIGEHAGDRYIVMELAEGCVHDLVSATVLPVPALLKMGKQAAAGMRFLAEKGIVHRDLALRNLLFLKHENNTYVVKVTDFGMARVITEGVYSRVGCMVPIRWTALEAITQGRFTVSSDVWSFGVTLWELLSRGATPYAELETAQVVTELQAGHRLSQSSSCPLPLYDLMLKCWDADPTKRPSFAELVEQLARIQRDSVELCLARGEGLTLSASDLPHTPAVPPLTPWVAAQKQL
eukprot:TRINITY_DN1372_c0_g1_i16.p1 TRINITY_DN1372_c0_g1~~TRINITY_DN1372_c0_g1_i16.p1  ORF type:complete len:649 (+),score=101.84 TRINITY_DN1372_c0_g1_i16:780-2726(+)